MVEQAWRSFTHNDSNGLIRFKKKLQDLKKTIRAWIRDTNKSYVGVKKSISDELVVIGKILDTGAVSDELLANRLDLSHKLHELNQLDLKEAAQKAKVKWAIEGDENSKKFHGPDFCSAILCFFDHGFFPRGCNSSFIALIPKVTDTKFVTDFRPISLIGSVYKVVTKILAKRLAMVISDLVSNTQSAFVAGRQILDGPFILNEILAWCKRKKKQAIIFKVNFAKAYDSVR
nr:RNA-directed DNA polymerase, eukaryota, reverse transcriptase zinc-binding domain protein [Tanacetum cinerariifolium]